MRFVKSQTQTQKQQKKQDSTKNVSLYFIIQKLLPTFNEPLFTYYQLIKTQIYENELFTVSTPKQTAVTLRRFCMHLSRHSSFTKYDPPETRIEPITDHSKNHPLGDTPT